MPQIWGVVQQALPTAATDGSQKQIRVDRYGSPIVYPLGAGFNSLAAEGSYYRACNTTMGTGIAMGIQAAFSDTANVLFVIRNLAVINGPNIHMDYIRLLNTAAGLTSTSCNLAVVLDTGNRYSTGGTQLFPLNMNTALGSQSVADLRYNCTATAATAKRQVSRAVVKTQAAPCFTIGDQIYLNFGSNASGMGALSGAAAINISIDCGPCCVAPNSSMLIHMWNPGNATTAPSWEFELGWWER